MTSSLQTLGMITFTIETTTDGMKDAYQNWLMYKYKSYNVAEHLNCCKVISYVCFFNADIYYNSPSDTENKKINKNESRSPCK